MKHVKYNEYKNSIIYWVGDIPSHWDVIRVKNHFFSKKQVAGNLADNYQRLALTLNGVIKRSKEDAEGLQPEKFETYQIVRKNSLIFKLIDLENIKTSRVGLSKYDGLVSPAYIILSDNGDILPNYAEKYFLNMWYEHIFNQLGSVGVRSNLNKEDVLNLPIIKPPLEEQKQIANYLDKNTAKIDVTIAKNEELIELLEEKSVALINQVVTKGLNPDVPMKDSGVEWMGEIPEHWDVIKMKFLGTARNGLTYKPENISDDGKLVLRSSNIQDGKLSFLDNVYINSNVDSKFLVDENDLLICSRNGSKHLIGKSALISQEVSGNTFGAFMMLFKSSYNKFIQYTLKSKIFDYYIDTFLTSTINQLTLQNFNNMIIPITLDVDEQNQISNYLDIETSKIERTITKIRKNITLLEEYKTSLIHHAVTGKIDVRGERI